MPSAGWDRKELVVPNREFITGRLLNWTLSDQVTRIMVLVGVAYGTDVDRALALMREAADENERLSGVRKPPKRCLPARVVEHGRPAVHRAARC